MNRNFPDRQGERGFQDDRITHTRAYRPEKRKSSQDPEGKRAWGGVAWLQRRKKEVPVQQLKALKPH